jgi:hypothetical protein
LSILICGPDFTLFEQIARITSFSAGVAEPQASKLISAALRLSLMNHSWIVERSVLENWTVPWSLMRLSRAG